MENFLTLFSSVIAPSAMACVTCNRPLQNAIFDTTFYPTSLAMLSILIVLGLIVGAIIAMAKQKQKARERSHSPLLLSAILLGIGLGGFIDGIVLHQLLQWHEMLSASLPPNTLQNKSVNMFWDGVFHLFSLSATIVGIVSLFRLFFRKDVAVSGNTFGGGLLLGWGLLNIVEGTIDHHILKLHNVREASSAVGIWNYAFLIASVLMILIAGRLIKKGFSEIQTQIRETYTIC